jgi:hypothetical protein
MYNDVNLFMKLIQNIIPKKIWCNCVLVDTRMIFPLYNNLNGHTHSAMAHQRQWPTVETSGNSPFKMRQKFQHF